jgi:hemerythrin
MLYSEDYRLGHPTLDSQHQLLFGLSGDLERAIEANHGRDALADLLQRLFAYVIVHFTTEDRLMMESGYPDAEAHRAEHRSLMATLQRLETDCQAGVPSAPSDVLRFMTAWALGHIRETDLALVHHLSAHPNP